MLRIGMSNNNNSIWNSCIHHLTLKSVLQQSCLQAHRLTPSACAIHSLTSHGTVCATAFIVP
eukprot:6272-Heterococcus_DN1.PRE.3